MIMRLISQNKCERLKQRSQRSLCGTISKINQLSCTDAENKTEEIEN